MLNPLKSVDQHIMDDTDLAGPILFCLLFATFLLLVYSMLGVLIEGWEKSFWICIWLYLIGNDFPAFHFEFDVPGWCQFHSHGKRARILFVTSCVDQCHWSHPLTRVTTILYHTDSSGFIGYSLAAGNCSFHIANV